VRAQDDTPEVAMIRTRNLKGEPVWTLPKGIAEEGEDGRAAAIREVREETGLEVVIVEALGSKTYWFASATERVRYRKTVHLYLMHVVGGDTDAHDHEVDEVAFFPVAEAVERATYRTDREILGQLASALTG